MIHRKQLTNFRTSEFSLSGGFLHSLLKPKYLNINVGELFEYIADSLWHVVGALNDSVDFTLVNVCSPFTKFSHGYLPPPPSKAWPTGKAMVFTFAVRNRRTYVNQIFNSNSVRRHSNSVTHFGFGYNNRDFVSISIDMQQGSEWGCAYPKSNELQYIYNLIGAMTKSFVRRQTAYLTAEKDYEDVHSLIDLYDIHIRLYRMPLKQMFLTVPYHLWPFNYHVWEYAPNILPQRILTPTVALYYFMYLNDAVSKLPRTTADVTMTRLGLDRNATTVLDDGIAGHLASSLIQLVSSIRTPDVQLTDNELLAPAVLNAFFKTGSTQLSTRKGYMGNIIQSFKDLMRTLQGRENEAGALLLPAKQTALKLLTQDRNWRQKTISALYS